MNVSYFVAIQCHPDYTKSAVVFIVFPSILFLYDSVGFWIENETFFLRHSDFHTANGDLSLQFVDFFYFSAVIRFTVVHRSKNAL